jgi:soluble lytic murein transglycosylase
MSCARLLAVLLVGSLAAGAGDDAHRQPARPGSGSALPAPRDAAAPAPPPDGGAAASVAPAAPLDEGMATAYFAAGDELAGAQAFALKDWKTARAAFTRARPAATGEAAARLDLMLGLCEAELGAWPEAARDLLAAHRGLPVIADYTAYQAARALYFAHQEAEALATARAVAAASIVGADAELLVGDLLRGGPAEGEIAHYRDYLARRGGGPRLAEARFRLAAALERGAAPGDLAEVVRTYRLLTIEEPLSAWATKAKDRLAALRGTLPADLAATLDARTGAEHLTEGKVLFDAMRNPESEAAFSAALADPTLAVADRCVAAYDRAQSRFKARDRKGAAPLFDEAITACHAAANKDLEIKSAYQAGRSYAYVKEHQTAIARYQAAQQLDPKHSYADDALLREGEEWASEGNDAKVQEVLASLPTRFPDGDNGPEALWRLGWRAWRAQRYDDAIGWWRKQLALAPHDDNYFAEGEAQYWLGRALAAQGKADAAAAAWEATARQYPAAYYALLALNRLREAAPKRYAALVAELAKDPAGYDPKAPAFTFKARPEWAAPGFARAMTLLRLGLGEPAAAELKLLGLTAPGDKKPVADPDRAEKLWAMVYLYDRAGRYATSHWPTRWHILDYRRGWPVGANRARWVIAYPKAYWELLTRHAALNKVPIAMQIAIVREESAFDPLDESYANAIGLTQMIPPTAKDFAKGTGIDPTREALRDPEKNVTIGSRFLGSLFTKWKGFTLLVPPSYNAGPAGVSRMLKVRGTWDADEFVEGIVDDQARNYTKRVLGSFFTYTWLYEGTVPTIPNRIPSGLLPK